MYCHKCGAKLPSDAIFCPKCACNVQQTDVHSVNELLSSRVNTNDIKPSGKKVSLPSGRTGEMLDSDGESGYTRVRLEDGSVHEFADYEITFIDSPKHAVEPTLRSPTKELESIKPNGRIWALGLLVIFLAVAFFSNAAEYRNAFRGSWLNLSVASAGVLLSWISLIFARTSKGGKIGLFILGLFFNVQVAQSINADLIFEGILFTCTLVVVLSHLISCTIVRVRGLDKIHGTFNRYAERAGILTTIIAIAVSSIAIQPYLQKQFNMAADLPIGDYRNGVLAISDELNQYNAKFFAAGAQLIKDETMTLDEKAKQYAIAYKTRIADTQTVLAKLNKLIPPKKMTYFHQAFRDLLQNSIITNQKAYEIVQHGDWPEIARMEEENDKLAIDALKKYTAALRDSGIFLSSQTEADIINKAYDLRDAAYELKK